MGVNKVILVGNLGKDPEVRVTQSSLPVASFSLATSERRKDQSGNWTNHTEWHRITAFGKLADFCSNYLKKGKQVYLEGKIRTSKWQDKEGKDRYTTDIIADSIQFVGAREGANDSGYTAGDMPAAQSVAAMDDAPAQDVAFDDDDIPF